MQSFPRADSVYCSLTQPTLDRLQAVTKESYRGPGTRGQTYLRSSTSASRSSSSSCNCWATKLSTVDEAICSAVQPLTEASCSASLYYETRVPAGLCSPPDQSPQKDLRSQPGHCPDQPVSCASCQTSDCSRIPVFFL